MLALLVTSEQAVPQSSTTRESMRDAITRTEYAFFTRDFNGLRASRDTFRQLTAEISLNSLAHYYVAYVDYRLALGDSNLKKNQVVDMLNHCVSELDLVLDELPLDADALALQSSCFGVKAGVQPLKAMVFGPRASRRMKKAQNADAANPRVALLEAISLYHRPGLFGGDRDKALKRFQEAAALYQAQTEESDLEPAWGEAEAFAYIGNIHLEQQDEILARNALEQALLLAPEYDWARNMLGTIGGMSNGQ